MKKEKGPSSDGSFSFFVSPSSGEPPASCYLQQNPVELSQEEEDSSPCGAEEKLEKTFSGVPSPQ